jgi:crossover junction endodeoxyribonuclease RuvC
MRAAGGGLGYRVVEAGVIRLDGKKPVADRLVELDADLGEMLDRLKPDAVAVEIVFSHVSYPATAITMAHARGVLLLNVRKRSIPLLELRPTAVKKSATGYGQAAKGQMQQAMMQAFSLAELPKPPDVADALAIALCAATRR